MGAAVSTRRVNVAVRQPYLSMNTMRSPPKVPFIWGKCVKFLLSVVAAKYSSSDPNAIVQWSCAFPSGHNGISVGVPLMKLVKANVLWMREL